MKKFCVTGLVAMLCSHTVLAMEAFVVKDIRIEGIQRTEAGTVFSYLPVKVGDTMTDERATQAIKALFATGFFKDVRLEKDGEILIVSVDERPAIASLTFTGLKAFKKEDMTKGLKEVGLAESRIFDRALVDRAEQELKRQYVSQGYYAVDIKTTLTPLERNRVGVSFAVTEGEVAKIKQIAIIGANSYREEELLDIFALKTSDWMSWYTSNDKYSKQKLSGDMETLRSFYLDRGFLEFSVDSTQVSISKDKSDIYITVNVSEGDQYSVSSVKLAGDLLLPEKELQKLVSIRPGDIFSRERLTETTKAISDRLGADGYAFANVNSAPELDKAKRQAAFTIMIDPGRRTYVRRINVLGNTKTRDEVIRREVRQMEGSWYDGTKINKSRSRVDKLGYFDEVTVETPSVPGTTDQVDVDLKVKERSTGSLTLGAGFGSGQGVVLSASVAQANLFGSGKYLAVQFSNSESNQVYSISHTDPYFTKDGVSRGFDAYVRKVDTDSLTVASYGADSYGGGVRFGVPIAEDDTIFFGLSGDSTTLKLTPGTSNRYAEYVESLTGCNVNDISGPYYVNTRCTAKLNTALGTVGWARDGRDSLLFPTKGVYQRASFELALPGSTATYYRASYQYQQFFSVKDVFSLPISRKWIFMANGELGWADSYGSGADMPFFKNYYAGGIGSIRGFESGTLGPRDTNEDPLGGRQRVVGNAELFLPVFGASLEKSVRVSAFVDAGNVWGYDTKMSFSDLRYSTGLAIAWSSPVGPLKFSIAKPLKEEEGDKTQAFQFQMGSTF
jgi:outer membrane protein insertion porin family